jgi:hypothetical protein
MFDPASNFIAHVFHIIQPMLALSNVQTCEDGNLGMRETCALNFENDQLTETPNLASGCYTAFAELSSEGAFNVREIIVQDSQPPTSSRFEPVSPGSFPYSFLYS